jgi:Lambda phage tail tube protein, TTP
VVVFGAVTGMPEINGLVGVVVAATSPSFTVDIDSSGFATAGTSGAATPYAASTWVTVANVKSYSGFDGSKSEVDTTHMLSAAKEFVPGLEDFGQFSLECDDDPADAGQIALKTNKSSNVNTYFRLVLASAKVRAWRGFVKKMSQTAGVDQIYKNSVDIRITGPVAGN